jgi:stress-induced morphogen
MRKPVKPKPRKRLPEDIALIESLLRRQFEDATVRRTNSLMLRVRIIDKRFRGLSKVARHEMVEPLIDQLPTELQEEIYFVVLLTPDEVAGSSMNEEFENPTPLLIA